MVNSASKNESCLLAEKRENEYLCAGDRAVNRHVTRNRLLVRNLRGGQLVFERDGNAVGMRQFDQLLRAQFGAPGCRKQVFMLAHFTID